MTVKVTSHPEVLFDHATAAFYAAADDTLKLYKANLAASKSHGKPPKRAGSQPLPPRPIDTAKMWKRTRQNRPTATIGSRKSPYTSVLERGGWTQSGRGVHIARANAPRPLTRAAEQFPKLYEARLHRMPIGAVSYMYHGPNERGPSEAILGLNR